MSIENLNQKLNGEIPVTREELKELINSWGKRTSPSRSIESNECYDLSKLDVSRIKDMSEIFKSSLFNGDISRWNTSNVTNMRYMFSGTKNFNSPLPWDTSKVTDMSSMFCEAHNFNQPLNFDTSKVIDMSRMFVYASNFNQALDNWNTSNVTNMHSMFWGAKKFNQPLNFDTSKVITVYGMFWGAKNFNQPLNWDTPKLEYAKEMFDGAKAFIEKYNNGETIKNPKEWLKQNRDKMLAIETLNKESTPEQKIAIIEDKISNNKTTLDELFKEKNIDPNSKIGLELLKVYNDTYDKLKLELEDLKTQVIDIATNDFNSI